MNSPANVQAQLGLRKPPIAVAFLDSPPPGVSAWNGAAAPAGCVFWKKAMDGEVFYTVPSDHLNCAVGAYTHGIPLPAERASELTQTLGFMVQNQYIAMEEVAGIPTLPNTPAVIAYGPLDRVSFAPDVVVLAVDAAQAMRLYEAALKAGVSESLLNALGRPACAILPLTRNTGSAALSLGCTGNRTYTDLSASEMYVCIPGEKWEAVAAQISTILKANETIGAFHQERKAQFLAV